MPVIDIDRIRGYLGRVNGIAPADDAELTDLVAMADSKVQECLGWKINQDTRTEYYPLLPNPTRSYSPEEMVYEGGRAYYFTQSGGLALPLRSLPVRSITSVTIDYAGYFGQVSGSFAGSPLTAGTDYYLPVERAGFSREGLLMRRNMPWPSEAGSIKVVYVSGFTAAELAGEFSNFASAIMKTVADYWNRYQQLKAGQYGKEMTSESIGGGVSASYVIENTGQDSIPDSAMDDLGGWVSYSQLEL